MCNNPHTPAHHLGHLPDDQHSNTAAHDGTDSLQHNATHCNTLVNIATLCYGISSTRGTLQHTATHCNTLQHTLYHAATLCDTLPWHVKIQPHCITLRHTVTHYNTLQHTTSCWIVPLHIKKEFYHRASTNHLAATHCNTLQHAAKHCKTLQHT